MGLKKPYSKPEVHLFAGHELLRAMRAADETRGRREGAQAMLWLLVEWARGDTKPPDVSELRTRMQRRLATFASEENAAEIALRTQPAGEPR